MTHMTLYRRMEPPLESFAPDDLAPDFPPQLALVSRLWFACGYRPGIGAYLNFFLLADFIVRHDTAFPPRFASFRTMADSFYRTDLFIRDVTDSGLKPTGGISSPSVRAELEQIMRRHQAVRIPPWMMTYFGFSLLENVEKQVGALSDEERRLHLAYMATTYRIMGMPFSSDRELMTAFAREVERACAAPSPNLERHARHILVLGEMVGVRSDRDTIAAMLPPATRAVYEPIHARVRPGAVKRLGARIAGRLLMKRAIGTPRTAVPVAEAAAVRPS